MEGLGSLIYIVFIIIFAIIRVSYDSRYGPRRNGYGRYGVYGMQDDFSLEYDPLAEIRQSYNELLQVYYRHNKPRTYLINKYCEARIIKEDNGKVWFYVKNKTTGNFSGAYFEVKGNNAHASTMWAIIDMEFNNLSRYSDIRDLYSKLNHSSGTTGGMRFFYQPITGGLPKPIINKMAQNEFCRMEVQTMPNGEKYILCSEIWGYLQWDKPRKFTITGDKLILYGILSEFSKDKNKMLNYLDLLYQYANRTDCTVRELNIDIEPVPNTNSAKELLKEMEQEQKQKQKTDINKEKKQEPDIEQDKDIKKFGERNIDL